MKSAANPQHGVINHLVAGRMHGHGFRHDFFDLVGHHAELAAMAPNISKLRHVVEHVEAEGMGADVGNAFFDWAVPRLLAISWSY